MTNIPVKDSLNTDRKNYSQFYEYLSDLDINNDYMYIDKRDNMIYILSSNERTLYRVLIDDEEFKRQRSYVYNFEPLRITSNKNDLIILAKSGKLYKINKNNPSKPIEILDLNEEMIVNKTFFMAWYDDNERIYIGTRGRVHVISKSNLMVENVIEESLEGNIQTIFSDNDKLYVFADRIVDFYDPEDPKIRIIEPRYNLYVFDSNGVVFSKDYGKLNSVCISSTDSRLIVTLSNGTIELLNKENFELDRTLITSNNDNVNITSILVDDLYITVGNEIGDIFIFDINSNYDETFIINNAENAAVNSIYKNVDKLIIGSLSKGYRVYKKRTRPYIDVKETICSKIIRGNNVIIKLKSRVFHNDPNEKVSYKIYTKIGNNKKIYITPTEFIDPVFVIDEEIVINSDIINNYNLSIIVELNDLFGISDDFEFNIETISISDPICEEDHINIIYQTIPTSDIKLKYSYFKSDKLGNITQIEEGIMNVITSNGTDWIMKVSNKGHLITEKDLESSFDNIRIPLPSKIPDILYFRLNFYTNDFSTQYPDNNEFYIYEYNKEIRPLETDIDGGFSLMEKFHIMDMIRARFQLRKVDELVLKSEDGSNFVVSVEDDNTINVKPSEREGENFYRLGFRIGDITSKVGIKSPNGKIWDFSIIKKGNGRTEDVKDTEKGAMVLKNILDIDKLSEFIKSISNPVTEFFSGLKHDKFKYNDKFDAQGNFINNIRDNMYKFNFKREGFGEEVFKAHSHFQSVYIDGKKVDRRNIINHIDTDGTFNVITKDLDIDNHYVNGVLMHRDLIDSEEFIKKFTIDSEDTIEKFYNGNIILTIDNTARNLRAEDFSLYIRLNHSEYFKRLLPRNFVIKLKDNRMSIQIKNSVYLNFNSEVLVTTKDIDREIRLELGSKKENPQPYYYLPLIQYDNSGDVMTYYTDDINEFEVIVNGFTLTPNKDYCIVNAYLHSHMPTMILFNEIVPWESNVEINFLKDSISRAYFFENNENSDTFEIWDDYSLFIEGTFMVFVGNRKINKNQYKIENRKTLVLKNIDNKRNVFIKFMYKRYKNVDSILKLLNSDSNYVNEEGDNPETINDFISTDYKGVNDENFIGKNYLLLGLADRSFNNNTDCDYDCNDENKVPFETHINPNIDWKLDYINNDLDIDCNGAYDKNDFELYLPPYEMPDINKNYTYDEPPYFKMQPSVIKLDTDIGSAIVYFRTVDPEYCNIRYFIDIDGNNIYEIFPRIYGSSVYHDLELDSGNHIVKYMITDGVNNVYSNEVSINITKDDGLSPPIIFRQPEIISSIYSKDVIVKFGCQDKENDTMTFHYMLDGNGEWIEFEPVIINRDEKRLLFSTIEGVHVLQLKISDGTSYRLSRELQFRIYDNNRPEFIQQPKILELYHSLKRADITFEVSDIDNDKLKIAPIINGEYISRYNIINTSENNYILQIGNLNPGNYDLKIEIIDKETSIFSEVLTFEMLNVFNPPEFIEQPYLKKISHLGYAEIEYVVNDSDGDILQHYVKHDSSPFKQFKPQELGGNRFILRFTNRYERNLNNIVIKVNDGNHEVSSEPIKRITFPENISPEWVEETTVTTVENWVKIDYKISDLDYDAISHFISIDGEKWRNIIPIHHGNGQFSYSYGDLECAKHTIRVRVSDGLNYISTDAIEFEII